MKKRYNNPILPGFYPDPSICRVGDDYYMVNSTFAYFPCVPIFHSKDLVHWEQIGNVIDRVDQIDLSKGDHNHCIYAPTLRYHNGTFYMITTNVFNKEGNFIVTAKDPKGPWSDPYILGSDGIDPSLFFDEDDRCYYCGTQPRREGSNYFGDNEIYIQELNLNTMKLIGESYPAWHGALKNVEWPEGPHIYKKDGWYYLLISEAGTGHNHAVSIARSKSLTEPFEGYKANPILTHRNLGYHYPISNVGHPDIVQTESGEWWMVLLASRPYGGHFTNLGRETFLVPFIWEGDWPVINPGIGKVEDTFEAPELPEYQIEAVPNKEDFDSDTLPFHLMYLRNPVMGNYSLQERKGFLQMKLSPVTITECKSPSFVGRRQTDMSFSIQTAMEFTPENENETAGLVLLQSNEFNYQFVVTKKDSTAVVKLVKCFKGMEEVITEKEIASYQGKIELMVEAKLQDLTFSFNMDGETVILAENIDARMLSTDVAGGFVGNVLGLYCSSNGVQSENTADFDYLLYEGKDQR